MPELPEVETVCKYLNLFVLNKTIVDVKIYEKKILKNIEFNQFKEKIKNQTITKIIRKGKYIIFLLTKSTLVSHLRMEGKYFYYLNEELLKFNKHKMIAFYFSHNDILVYSDTRKFGTMHFFLDHNFLNKNPLKKLGIEPFDKNFNAQYLESN